MIVRILWLGEDPDSMVFEKSFLAVAQYESER